MVSTRNDFRDDERAQKFHVTIQVWAVLLIGRDAREICVSQSEELHRSG